MNKSSFLALALALGICFPSFSQKVKYKDLFILLSQKQYDQAEPFLKRYLKENTDNPNAYLYMGIIYQDKSAKMDVLKQADQLILDADSAVYFYGLAVKGITEKELKRNDEYYQMYNRRDLRTGEFGVKLSDVQLDLEKRQQALKERKEKINQLNASLHQSEVLYQKSVERYKAIVNRYPSEKQFFLRTNDEQVKELNRIIDAFDSSMAAFSTYKAISQTLGKTGYNQNANLQEIRVYDKDGLVVANFMVDDVRLWDYKKWVQGATEAINKDIKPLRENLVTYDVEINKLREKIKKDSVAINTELASLSARLRFDQLKRYDPKPMPILLFEMKMAELEYASELIHNKAYKDSADVRLKLNNSKREMTALRKLDSLSTLLADRNLDKEAEDYEYFVNSSYGTTAVLKSLASTTREFAEREKLRKNKELTKRTEAFKWLVVANDSIPIVTPVVRESRFKPIILVEEEYTAGLSYIDSLATGYFYRITPSRIPDIKVSFTVDKNGFKKRNLPVIKGLSATDGKKQVYFVCFYSESKMKDKFPVTVAKIAKTGVVWNMNYQFDLLPTEIIYNADAGDLSVKVTTGTGENKLLTIDKAGKLIK